MRKGMQIALAIVALCGVLHASEPDEVPRTETDNPVERILLCTPQGPVILQMSLLIEGRPYRRESEDVVDEHLRMIAGDRSWNAALENRKLLGGRIVGYKQFLRREQRLKQLDPDADGQISRGELRAALLDETQGDTFGFHLSPREPDWDDLVMSLIDMDADGRLSADELRQADAHLALADTNGDGALYPSEVAAADPRRPSRVANLVVLLGRPQSAAQATRELRAHYADADGKIVRSALHIVPGLFDRLDADRDGELQDPELGRIISLPAHIILSADLQGLDATWPLHLEVKGVSPELLIRQPAGFRMDQSRHTWRDELHLEIFGQRRGAASTIEYRVRVMMALHDRDKNGYLDSKEVAGAFEFDAYSLAALDLDGDGKVVPNELEAALQRDSTVTRSLIQIEFHRRGPSLWNLLDTNVDQILSERELRKLGELLRKFDIDGDGVIAYHECPFALEVQINRGVRSDRSSRRQYLQPSRAKLGNSPPTWFLRMDANGDSDISLREFLGTAEQFQRLDTDRDGLIDAREAEKATP